MEGKSRNNIEIGMHVSIVMKKDQKSHPHGIKVKLEDGNVGRVIRTVL